MDNTDYLKISQRKSLGYKKDLTNKKMREHKLPILLILLHIPLGLLLYRSSALAFLHPMIVFFLGLYWAIDKREKIEKVAYVAAYLVGAEVLWRMAESAIFWEFGKYAISIIMAVALIRRGCWKIPKLVLLYFVFLLPACLLTIMNNSLSEARAKISFNLSGPLALFVCCWFFSYIKVNGPELKKLLLTLTIPIMSIAVTTLFYTVTIQDIQFTTESNQMLSGGFGPNQVSSILGMGVFVCLAIYILLKNAFKETIYLGFMALLFAAQSVLTFSRGGMYNAIGAVLVLIVFQMQHFSQGLKRLVPVFGIGVVFLFLVFPYLDDFTGGKLQTRFDETKTTGRLEIIEADYEILQKNPLLGAGVGEAKSLHKEYLGKSVTSHTEFSRVLSEHGFFGILALLTLALMVIYNIKGQKLSIGKALVGGVVIWSFLFMLNAGMRLAAPSFMIGVSFLTILTRPNIRKKKPLRITKKQHMQIVDQN